MVQTVQPESDAFVDDWDNQLGNGIELFASIQITPLGDDPDPPTLFVDDTFIISETEPMGDVYVTKLRDFINPEDLGDEWKIKFRAQKQSTSGVVLDLTVQLREDYVDETDEDSRGDLIFEQVFENIANGFQDFEVVMTVPDAINPDGGDINPTSIDTSKLFVRLVADTS